MKKHTKRKVYSTSASMFNFIVEGVAFTPQERLDKLRLLELGQIEALQKGQGTLQDLKGLGDCLNLCETMADAGIGPEALVACQQSQEAIIAIMARCDHTGEITATPEEVHALREVYAYHDLQRQSISRADYERYIKRTAARVKTRHHKVVEIA